MKLKKKGFTLVEIMIVVAIIAILAAVAIPNFVRYRKTSQMNACISNLKQLVTASEQWKMNNAGIPDMADLVGADKYIKVTPTCPAKGTYTKPATDTDDWTCSVTTEAEYAHILTKTTTSTGD